MKIAFLSLCNPTDHNYQFGNLCKVYFSLKQENEVDWIGEKISEINGYDQIVYADYFLVANLLTDIPLVYMGDIEKVTERSVDVEDLCIPVYVINLKEREERRKHILKEFEGKDEFDLTLFDACKHAIGAVGLWYSMVEIIRIAQESDDDAVIICEDDHFFTEHYSKEYLFKNIFKAHSQGADVLSGGIGGFGQAIPLLTNCYWVDWFWCTQFIVVYKKFYQKILDYPFKDSDTADGVISEISFNTMVMYPFISEQKDFGHSDVTENNMINQGLVTELFRRSDQRMKIVEYIVGKYMR